MDRIKAGELDPYKALEKYVSALAGRGLAPKTIRGYLTATRGLLRHVGIKLDDYEVRLKVGVPPDIESSLDRIPTRDELRLLLMNSDPRARALISLMDLHSRTKYQAIIGPVRPQSCILTKNH